MKDKDDQKYELEIKTTAYSCPLDHQGGTAFLRSWNVLEKKSLEPTSTFPPVILVHEIGHTSQSLESLALAFAQIGICSYIYDLRGHSPHSHKPGAMESIPVLAKDLLQVVAWVKHLHFGQKPVILACGFSGVIGVYFGKHYSQWCHSLCFIAPNLRHVETFGSYKQWALGFLKEVYPNGYTPSWVFPFSYGWFSKSQNTSDLVPLTNKTSWDFFRNLTYAQKWIIRLTVPTIFFFLEETDAILRRLLEKNKQKVIILNDLLEIPKNLF